MLWQLVVMVASFLLPSGVERSDVSPTHPRHQEIEWPSYGPQSAEERILAHQALHGEHPNGDMLFADDEAMNAGIKDTKYRWPKYPGGGEVPYVIDKALASIKPKIEQAMQQYHKLTCIKFVPRTTQKDYINIFKGVGCYSWVGRQGKGKQDVSIGDGCQYVGTIVHELGHAIGLYHQHQRSDRDTYINVYEKNVVSGKEHNFNKTLASDEFDFDTKTYDYSSIMQYGEYAFSKQPKVLKTMEAKKTGITLLEPYQKPGFTNTDIDMVKKLYKCK